jgi:hypothetical protein
MNEIAREHVDEVLAWDFRRKTNRNRRQSQFQQFQSLCSQRNFLKHFCKKKKKKTKTFNNSDNDENDNNKKEGKILKPESGLFWVIKNCPKEESRL